MKPGDGGCTELRLHHCTPAWPAERDSVSKKTRKENLTLLFFSSMSLFFEFGLVSLFLTSENQRFLRRQRKVVLPGHHHHSHHHHNHNLHLVVGSLNSGCPQEKLEGHRGKISALVGCDCESLRALLDVVYGAG